MPASCNYDRPIPNPPTTSTACSVPIGGSNTTILDTCCNGHINPFKQYGAPGEDTCYQYCTTQAGVDVQNCLRNKLGNGTDDTSPLFMCYNVVEGKGTSNDYEGTAVRTHGKMSVGMVLWASLVVYHQINMSRHVAAELEEHTKVKIAYADLVLHQPQPTRPVHATATWLHDDEYLEKFSAALRRDEVSPSSSPGSLSPELLSPELLSPELLSPATLASRPFSPEYSFPEGIEPYEAPSNIATHLPDPVSQSLWTRHELSLRAMEDALPPPVEPPVRVQASKWPSSRDKDAHEQFFKRHDTPHPEDTDLEAQAGDAAVKRRSQFKDRLKALFKGGRSRSSAQDF
ncbi:hypothetical protein K491DRAFT_676404 [Lophiostoma macrostomum CBS 122681]|uniref:Uncharacterized protein n=1 Tax=Lophiostoma macrostomum CBS 122681 TaxID=1314788 RepID=A0A6A6TED0_9PLEO|nr:hypothetical protein K491DRAFT_676404 [Lophiostoma macrostomum CBS 122681]